MSGGGGGAVVSQKLTARKPAEIFLFYEKEMSFYESNTVFDYKKQTYKKKGRMKFFP